MRLMYDSIHASSIPAGAQMVAGYINGPISQWSAEDWARFPNATKVRISVSPWTNDGHVLDVESGDAIPAHAPHWVLMRRESGLLTPTVYCSLGELGAVRAAFAASRVPEPLYWIARPGDATLAKIPGAVVVATQYEYDGAYDVSAVADYWPGVDDPENHADDSLQWQVRIMGRLPTLMLGAKDTAQSRFVHRLQGLLLAVGISPGALDGVFGPKTLAAVKTAQHQYGLVIDGVVGPHTWSVLITGQDL